MQYRNVTERAELYTRPAAGGGWRFEAIRRTRDEGRWTKKEREIKKVRRLENRKRNAGWINPINLIN